MKDKVSSTLTAIFNEAIELDKIKNTKKTEQIDYGELFFKPPTRSTPNSNSTGGSSNFYFDRSPSVSPEIMHPKVASLFSRFTNSLNMSNNLSNNSNVKGHKVNNLSTSPLSSNLLDQQQAITNRQICTSTPIKTLCTNAHNVDSSKDVNLIATARNLSTYLSPANCSITADNTYRTFNYPMASTNLLFRPYNQSIEQNTNGLTYNPNNLIGNSNLNTNRRTNNSRHLMNSYMSNELSSPDYSFGKGWQDKKQLSVLYNSFTGVYLEQIYSQARSHRQAAQFNVAQCTWRGYLATRPTAHKNPVYSRKVFLGGVPWDITNEILMGHFSRFGRIEVVWPREIRNSNGHLSPKCGYVYIVFENQDRVKALLHECTYNNRNGGKYYYHIPTKRMPNKEVQVIPWIMADSNYVRNPSQRLDPRKTIFAGALHGLITAEALAIIMNDLFGSVVYVGIDTDGDKYPSGSARVCFSTTESYIRAIMAGFVEVKSNKFNKKIQLDPYLEPSNCSNCCIQPGTVFCRTLQCFRYFCVDCYYWIHSHPKFQNHYPMMRIKREQK